MFRKVTLFMPLLLIAGAVVADDALESTTAPQRVAANKEQPKPEAHANKEEPKADAEAKKEEAKAKGDVNMSGMSILGNDEAPKSLVIVPWKGSQLGETPGISRLLDDSTQPVDKEVFMRELAYYQIRSNSK
jgi:hypothetical protein